MPSLILKLRSLMNLKRADPRLSYPVLKGLWVGLRDFSVLSKFTGVPYFPEVELSLILMRFTLSLLS